MNNIADTRPLTKFDGRLQSHLDEAEDDAFRWSETTRPISLTGH